MSQKQKTKPRKRYIGAGLLVGLILLTMMLFSSKNEALNPELYQTQNREVVLAKTAPASTDAGQPTGQPTGQPNFIIILADDMGYGDMGHMGPRASRPPTWTRWRVRA